MPRCFQCPPGGSCQVCVDWERAEMYQSMAAQKSKATGMAAADWLRGVADLLEKKSQSYGDSIGSPIRVFSKAGKADGIRVRIDDKLSRIKNGSDSLGDNDLQDLVGYVACLAVVKE